jgi:DNA-binding CsgD family transcriptional regulator
MRNRQFTNRDLERMEAMALRGCNAPTIAAAIGCNRESVRKYVGDIMRRVRQPRTRFNRDHIRRLARERHSTREIAAKVGCSPDTAYRIAGDIIRRNAQDNPMREQIRKLAREGRSREYIATALGIAKSTAHRHARDIFDAKKAAQEARRLHAYEQADADGKRELAAAFGYANVRSMWVSMHFLRRRLSAETKLAA